MQKSQRSKIQYFRESICYSIDWLKQTHIRVRIKDVRDHKQMIVFITDELLKEHSITTADLITHIQRQSIHEGQQKLHLLKFNDNSIVLSFNFPKCQIKKSLRFQGEWIMDTPRSTVRNQSKGKQCQQAPLKMFQLRMGKAFKQMDIKLLVMDQQMNTMKEKVKELEQRSCQLFKILKSESKRYMQNECQKLIDSNSRYFHQFEFMEQKLYKSLETTQKMTGHEFKRIEELLDEERMRVDGRFNEQFDERLDERFDMKFDRRFDGRFEESFDAKMDEKFDKMFNESFNASFNASFNKRFNQRSDEFIEELSELREFKESVHEIFKDLKGQIAEIESRHLLKYQKDNFNVSDQLTTSIFLSSKHSVFTSSGKQPRLETPIKKQGDQISIDQNNEVKEERPMPFDNE